MLLIGKLNAWQTGQKLHYKKYSLK